MGDRRVEVVQEGLAALPVIGARRVPRSAVTIKMTTVTAPVMKISLMKLGNTSGLSTAVPVAATAACSGIRTQRPLELRRPVS